MGLSPISTIKTRESKTAYKHQSRVVHVPRATGPFRSSLAELSPLILVVQNLAESGLGRLFILKRQTTRCGFSLPSGGARRRRGEWSGEGSGGLRSADGRQHVTSSLAQASNGSEQTERYKLSPDCSWHKRGLDDLLPAGEEKNTTVFGNPRSS